MVVLIKLVYQFTMYGMNNMKVISVQQARNIHHYKNTKEKLLTTNAAIWFNKRCTFKTPNT